MIHAALFSTGVLLFQAMSCAEVATRASEAQEVRIERDIPYAETENPRQRLDLYLPAHPTKQRLPVIVFIHGGGWQGGDRGAGGNHLTPYVQSGRYAGVSVGYRLTHEATWPAQIHDCKAAIRWVRANADERGLDADRIAVCGTSAGGHLSLLIGTTGDVPELEGTLGPHVGTSSHVAAVVNFFGPTDFTRIGTGPDGPRHLDSRSPASRLLGGALDTRREAALEASPVTHVTPNDPPVLTVHGSADAVVSYQQAERLDEVLRAAGVTHYLVRVEGAGHGGFRGGEVERRTSAFLARTLHGEDQEVSTAVITQGAAPARPMR